MDKTQDDNPLHPGFEAWQYKQKQLAAEDAAQPSYSPTHPAPAENGKAAAQAGGSPTPGLEDTVSFRPETMGVELPARASTPGKIRVKAKTDTVVIPNAGRMISMRLSQKTPQADENPEDYRQWLGGKSKDELIDLILNLDTQVPEIDATDKIAKVRVEEPAQEKSEGFQIPQNLSYLRLPTRRKTGILEPTPAWRIVLISLDQSSSDPVGLLIDDEITVGRTAGDTRPDLDLTPFGAKTKGISRVHALIRPHLHQLALIDNDSSNGTFWNRLRIPAQTEQPIKEGDVIAFGRANFLVKIVKAPDTRATRTLI